jgi:AcrR family transcriptional regulator
MTVTPWGDSASLRERRLKPIRGAPRERIAQNQRERLFAAAVAVVSEKGFAAAKLGDLLALSGVSSRSFYALFPDKSACVAATVKATLERCAGSLKPPAEGEDLRDRLRAYYLALADAVIAQPAAARLCLIDSFAAGPVARRAVEAAQSEVEAGLRGLYRTDPVLAELSEEIIAARVGAVLDVVISRLRRGALAELPDLADDLVPVLLADRPPPRTLRALPRPAESSESLSAVDPVERAIRAFAVLVREAGYEATKVEDVVRLASMSSRTFYANFSGKQDLMASAIDSACAQAVAAVAPAFSRGGDWPEAVRAGFVALFNFISARPDLARLVLVEAPVAGEAATSRANQGLAPLGQLLINNTTEWSMMPPVLYEMIAATIRALIREMLKRDGIAALATLTPLCTYLTLSPFIDPEAAIEAAGSSGARPAGPTPVTRRATETGVFPWEASIRSGLWRVLHVLLIEREATAAEIVAEVDDAPDEVADFLRELTSIGALETIEIGGEVRYRHSRSPHRLHIRSIQQEGKIGPEERRQLNQEIWSLILSDVKASMAEGTFEKPDRWMVVNMLTLDQRGWRERSELHDQVLLATFEIQIRNEKRLQDSPEPPIFARSVQLAFERLTPFLPVVDQH